MMEIGLRDRLVRISASGALALTVSLMLSGVSTAAEPAGGTLKAPTFAKDITPIFQEKCQDCHRKGSMAPMSLITYEETRPWAKKPSGKGLPPRNMPPWHLDKTVGIQQFQNDISLSDAQISRDRSLGGRGRAAQRSERQMPPAKLGGQPTTDGNSPNNSDRRIWSSSRKPIRCRPGARTFGSSRLQKVPVTEARWVQAVEMRPSTAAGRRITHHVLARLIQDEPDALAINDGSGGGPSSAGLLMEWAIGKTYDVYRPNTGKLLLPGSQIWWEMHLHAVGEEIRDQAELAVYLYPKGQEPKYRTRLTLFGATATQGSLLDIKPNSITETEGFHVLPQPARLENFQPHMHLRGKAMAIEAILPNGTRQMLSYVDHFNFQWMTNYIYADDAAPVLPKGTIIHVTAWHDNTTANPNNPDHDQWVGWGDRTVDEMAHAWVNVTYISEQDYQDWLSKHRANPAATSQRASN